MLDEDSEEEALEQRARETRRRRTNIIIGACCLVALSGVVGSLLQSRAQAPRPSATPEAQPKPTAPRAEVTATPPRKPIGAWVATVAALVANPTGSKLVELPRGGEPHRTYETTVAGLGKVIIWVTAPGDCEVVISADVATLTADDFAPGDGVTRLDQVRSVQHWYVRAGPLDGKFLMRSEGGWRVRTALTACKGTRTRNFDSRDEQKDAWWTLPILKELCATL